MRITIPGDPVAQHRPRFSRKLGRAFNSQAQVKDCLTWHVASQWGDSDPLDGPVVMNVVFYMKIPKSTSKKRKASMEGEPCLKKKDIDNLFKMAADCCIGIVFNDDSQVWAINARKVWSSEPRTELEIIESAN